MQRILALDFSTYMPGSVLTKVDRASMAHGLEVRPPLLDDGWSTGRSRCRRATSCGAASGKYLLKLAARGKIPDEIIDRPKKGFGIPLASWLRGPLKDRIDEVVARSPVFDSRHPRPAASSAAGTTTTRASGPTTASRFGRCSCWITGSAATRIPASDPRMATDDESEDSHRARPIDSVTSGRRYSAILPESRGQLERWLGSTTLASFAGKRVMDVGCGMGRNPYWYARGRAPTSVLGVDMDDGSLAAARKNLAPFANARVEKALRARPGSAGRTAPSIASPASACCTTSPSPRTRSSGCGAASRPGGDLVLWCYAKEGNRLMLPVIQTFRALGSRLPIERHPRDREGGHDRWLGRPSRTIPFRTDYYRRLRTLSFRNVESIIFDQMLPHIAHYWTREDMERLAGLLDGGRPRIEFVAGQQLVRDDQPNVARSGGQVVSRRMTASVISVISGRSAESGAVPPFASRFRR